MVNQFSALTFYMSLYVPLIWYINARNIQGTGKYTSRWVQACYRVCAHSASWAPGAKQLCSTLSSCHNVPVFDPDHYGMNPQNPEPN